MGKMKRYEDDRVKNVRVKDVRAKDVRVKDVRANVVSVGESETFHASFFSGRNQK